MSLPPSPTTVTWSSLHHSYGSSIKIICPAGKEVKDKSKTHNPEKLPPSVKGNKMKTVFRERKPTYSTDDNDGRILRFVGQEDRNYPTPCGPRLGEAGDGLGGGKGKVI